MEILSKLPVEKITDEFTGRIEPNNSDKILWLHGYTGDSSIWGEIWSMLPGWYHIGIDLPGHGSSTPMAENSNLRDLGQRLGKVCISAILLRSLTARLRLFRLPLSFLTCMHQLFWDRQRLRADPRIRRWQKRIPDLFFCIKWLGQHKRSKTIG